jgi:hypothetical protein
MSLLKSQEKKTPTAAIANEILLRNCKYMVMPTAAPALPPLFQLLQAAEPNEFLPHLYNADTQCILSQAAFICISPRHRTKWDALIRQ